MARLLFFGNERLATGLSTSTPVFEALVAAGYEIAAVVVAQKTSGASRNSRQLEIEIAAESHGIPVIAPESLKSEDTRKNLANFKADAAVLVAYGKIVPQTIIDIFPRGIINIHPSLLPRHRGSIPLESVILTGETTTGVSVMALHAEMDAGPVYAQQTIELSGAETKAALADKLVSIGKDLLLQNLPAILDDSLTPKDQDHTKATYDQRIDKSMSELDFQTKSAETLAREVRAYAGWPRSRCTIGTTEVVVTEAQALTEPSGVPGTLWLDGKQIGIYCSSGVLQIEKLIPSGKKEMSASSFMSGYRP